MLQRLGIRGKLLAVVMVPVLVLLSTVAYIGLSAIGDYRTSANAQQLVDTLGEARETQDSLQLEREAALNFVHTIQDSTEKLAVARDEVATRYDALASAAGRSEDPRAEGILAAATEAVGGTGDAMLAEPRAVSLTPASAAGEWIGLPTTEETDAMIAAYDAAVERLDEIAAGTPDELDLRIPLAALSYSIENERLYARTLLVNPAEYKATLESTFTTIDEGLDAIAAAADQVAVTDENAQALAAVAAGAELRDALPQVREGVMSGQAATATVTNFYTEVIGTFVAATDAIAIAVPDREVVSTLQAYGALDQLIESIRYEGDVFNRLIRQGTFVTAEIAQTRTIVERTRIALEDAQARGAGVSPAIEVPALGASGGSTANSFSTLQNRILNGLDSSLVSARSADWPAKVDEEVAQYAPLRDQAWEMTEARVNETTSSALTQAIFTIAIGIAAIVVSLIITFAIARRIVNPLRRLTTTATAVREELPRLVERVAQPGETVDVSEVQIPVETQDEVGRLAEAFNGVNAATIEIAREQAALRGSISEMFVNVARRDQVLLNRQLASIDEMERTEDDPNRLTRLFALDHLATRMRRNSESLLVLAGIDTGRRLRRAMPLSDVVRTASSEIELYERIDLELIVDPAMLGHQALTAAHLFAELLENATVFSDPGSRVVIRTGRTVDGFTVEVIDSGIGMTPEELAEANARVQSSAASEILGAQRLGLFVVGRIARRIGAQVAIASEEGRGTVATVLLPSSLFEAIDDSEPDALPASSVPSETAAPAPAVAEPAAPAVSAAASLVPAADAYAPAAMVEGASLSGRTVEEDDDSIPMPVGIDALIAADASAAPVATPVSHADLTEGVSGVGLPTRRRRSQDDDSASGEERNVIGLPVRATADQLSALEAEQAAFTPAVSAAEVAPQTPEERASVFRGFRPRRESEPSPTTGAVPVVAPAVEPTPALQESGPTPASVGGAFAAFDAIRRAAAAQQEASQQAVSAPEPEPAAEPEPVVAPEPEAPALPTFSMPKLSTSEMPLAPLARRSPTVEEPAAREVVSEDLPAAPASPFARSPYGALFAAAEPALQPDAFAPFDPASIPGLEPDEHEVAAFAVEEDESSSVQVPVLEDDAPVAVAEPAPLPWAQAPAPAAITEPTDEPAPTDEPEPAMEAAVEQEEASARAPWLDAAAFATATAAVAEAPAEPAPYQPLATGPTAPEPRPEPAADAGVTQVALSDPYGYVAPHPSMDDIIAQASGEEAGRAGFFGRLFGRGRKDDEPSPASAMPTRAPFAPISNEPVAPAPAAAAFEPEATAPTPPAAFDPAPYLPPTPAPTPPPASFAPEPGAPVAEPFAFTPAPAAPEPTPAQPAAFSPEQLANPLGWEAAGASALEAATFEAAATTYEPRLDTDHPSGRYYADEEADLTRSVFSELSSLSESRPKVEKTRAGLQKRRAVTEKPVEVTPIAEEVTLTPKDRDAEAVRHRFSSFYSGTQRARSDVEELELRSTPQPANE